MISGEKTTQEQQIVVSSGRKSTSMPGRPREEEKLDFAAYLQYHFLKAWNRREIMHGGVRVLARTGELPGLSIEGYFSDQAGGKTIFL